MAVNVQLADLFHGMIESFKLLLTSQTFGSDYELLCAELSVQLLRIRLWADSVGLVTQDGNPRNLLHPLLDRQDFNETATQTIESISFLLCELQVIRDKYMLRTLPSFDVHRRSTTPGSFIKAHNSFRLRSWANQKQKSIFAVARWTVRDERTFDKKVKRLGALITGLEDIARAAERPPDFQLRRARPISLGQDEIPPPYSLAPITVPRRSIHEWSLGQIADTNAGALHPVAVISIHQRLFTMEAYLIGFHPSNFHVGPTARDKLVELPDRLFEELCVDVCDELLRRQEYEQPSIRPLQERQLFHPKRNQARKKLSTLVSIRFGHLIEDIVFELKRRYPHLQSVSNPYTRSLPPYRGDCVCSHLAYTPPPLLQFRCPHWSTIIHGIEATDSPPIYHIPLSQSPLVQSEVAQSAPAKSDGNTSILISYHVKMDDSCSTVLPAILLKYGITAAWLDYSLYIIYDDEERCLEMDEKPLRIFKMLEKQRKSPRFMLRRISPVVNVDG